MSERALSAELISRIQAGVVRPCLFIYADFPSGAKRYWTGVDAIDWDGETWEGGGAAIGFETFSETVDTSARGMKARVKGVDLDFANALVAEAYQGRAIAIWLGFFNEAEDDLEVMEGALWQGSMDTDEIEAGKDTISLVISAEHHLTDLLRKRGYRYTDADQQALYPEAGDTGLNKIPYIQDLAVHFGPTGDE